MAPAVDEYLAKGFKKLTDDGGVLKKVEEEGEEAEYEDDDETPPPGAMVSIHFTGSFPGGGAVFETSEGKAPTSFTLGEKRVVPGWEVAVATMKKNEKCTVYLASAYGYGKTGNKGIAPDQPLEFELHLIEWI